MEDEEPWQPTEPAEEVQDGDGNGPLHLAVWGMQLSEVQEEMSGGGARLEEEIGDLLFAAVNLARKLKVDPEVALSRATRKFINRFQSVEALAKTRNLKVEEQSLEALDVLWDEVKRRE